ncbi:MAG: transcription-repair coupling factor [Sedimentisphaerales bacterium]|nr:transcription-repair coupling factor [Sedimentisphaerales bacterium]MBN2842452.1 transcription-repair coupling factor [Sedimentisphaerales bacterium]
MRTNNYAAVLRETISSDPGQALGSLLRYLAGPAKSKSAELYGSWGSFGRLAATAVNSATARPVLYLTGHIDMADKAQDDLETFSGQSVDILPASELAAGPINPVGEIAGERLKLWRKLAGYRGNSPLLVSASIAAVMQPAPAPSDLKKRSVTISIDDPLAVPMDKLVDWLVDAGYQRCEDIDTLGDFACRGGIVDVFPPGNEMPVRIEYFGDEVESVRYFDMDTRRSVQKIDLITLPDCRSDDNIAAQATLLDYLPDNTIVVIEEITELIEIARIFRDRAWQPDSLWTVDEIIKKVQNFDRVYINRFAHDLCEQSYNINARSIHDYHGRGLDAIDDLTDEARLQNKKVFILCDNPAQQLRTKENIECNRESTDPETGQKHVHKGIDLPENLSLAIGVLAEGFSLPDHDIIVAGHHELFGVRQVRRKLNALRQTQAIESFNDLVEGELIVHFSHGIGKYRGMKLMTKNGREEEFLALEFADQMVIHLPAGKIDLVHKYVASGSKEAKLSKIGGRTWQNQKDKVSKAVEDMASGLIDLQAYRNIMPGIRYPQDDHWQKEFEAAFPYQPTEDQVKISAEIKADMQKPRPMDRLLCGDVGYGKTELAIRAAFKAATFGKQVAVLVPTTILADQHYRSFKERMSDFPVSVECISRFRTGNEVKRILNAAADGRLDILIGTHRILSDDVKFKDLGLVIIDEEQRFGVAHKEKLKSIRKTVDILTMTATPLPRTMHSTLLGIRDISSLTTPPLDRRSISTAVIPPSDKLVTEAIMRELSREGQVFFLHNRVQSIASFAAHVKCLVPQARVIFAHGQMPKSELEKKISDFIDYKADVLVSTTIIESGIDIPRANTIIIDEADRFGLAELHQLRGRVGRYKHKAYAYMLLPRKRKLNPIAVKRLKAIEEYSSLGSGFRIAMRDLEIRGAGNILGFEQSGFIDSVGYELYCRLLASAIRKLKGEPEPIIANTLMEINISNNIPRSYIPSEQHRMEIYRRMVTCSAQADVELLRNDIKDQFGNLPDQVEYLLQIHEIRIRASEKHIECIIQKDPDIIFKLGPQAHVATLFRDPVAGSLRIPDQRTVHLRLGARYFEHPSTLLSTLRKLLS